MNSDPRLDQAGASPSSLSVHRPDPSSPSSAAALSPILPPQPFCDSPMFSQSESLELHIEEDRADTGVTTSRPAPLPSAPPPRSPPSSLSPTKDMEPEAVVDVSATMLSSQHKSLVVLSHSSNSRSTPSPTLTGPPRAEPSPVNTPKPSLSPIHIPLKPPSPSVELGTASPTEEALEPTASGLSLLRDLDLNFSAPSTFKSLTPPSASPSKSPLPATVSKSPSPILTAPKAPSPSSFTSPRTPTTPALTRKELVEPVPASSPMAGHGSPGPDPSLDEALDKLLAMSFTKIENNRAARVEREVPQLKREALSLNREVMQEVSEEPVLAVDRSEVQPDTSTQDGSVDGGPDGQMDGLLDWADVELNMSLNDGLDGSMTPYTERPYTDGSMTPLTEASWMDDSLTPSSCPGTPDAALDLPLLQPATLDRVSASGHLKSVIRRTKEIPNVHPMYREGQLRRKMGPIIVNKSNSQDRLIEELQGKLGIGRSERRRKQPDDWLTEGVIVMSKPQRFREGVGVEVDKVGLNPFHIQDHQQIIHH